MELKYIVDSTSTNLKEILREKLSISERLYKKIKINHIFINGMRFDYLTKLSVGDIITINLDFDENNSNIIANNDIHLNILYEDEWLLIIDKPSGIPVHPSFNHYNDSLSNGVKYYYDIIGLHQPIRPVNRLDNGTSGIVIFAKSEYIQENLRNYIKEYIAVIIGHLDGAGTIDKPIARKKDSIIERCISDDGDRAITNYEVVKNIDNYIYEIDLSVVKCKLETGRTHQIRVHFASIGHPLLGDTLYGTASKLISRQALHAYHIHFTHPVTRKEIDIYSEIPYDIKSIIK